MPPGPTTLVVEPTDHDAVVAALAGCGFVFAPGRSVSATVLDTFDARLHRAGTRLTIEDAGSLELVLSQDGGLSTHHSVHEAPRSAADLETAGCREAIAALIGTRPLLSRLRFQALQSRALCRDEAGEVIAEAVVSEQVTDADDHAGTAQPISVVEVGTTASAPKSVRRAIKALARAHRDPAEGDSFDVIARLLGVTLASSARPAAVLLDPDSPAAAGVRDVLAHLATSIEANWRGTVDHDDSDYLHDLRVAVRRTRSIIVQAKGALPPKLVAHAGRKFGRLGDITGPARDLDVYLAEWDDYARPLGPDAIAALEPVRAVLVVRQEAAQDELSRAMSEPANVKLRKKWPVVLAELTTETPQGTDADRTLGSVVHQCIIQAHELLIERGRLIEPETPAEQVHDLRKDAKRLRYLLECFATILADGPRKKFVKRLKALQDNLGTHQDAEVHVLLLQEIASELDPASLLPDTTAALEQLTERLDQIRLAARERFAERFAAYDTEVTTRALDEMLAGLDQ